MEQTYCFSDTLQTEHVLPIVREIEKPLLIRAPHV